METAREHGTLKDLVLVDAKETVKDAWSRMKANGIRHLPVTDDDQIIGMVTPRDLLRALLVPHRYKSWDVISEADFDSRVSVDEVMSWPVSTMKVETSLKAAVDRMIREKVSAFVLKHPDGRVAGIMTSEDLLRAFHESFVEKAEASRSDQAIRSWAGDLSVMQILQQLSNSGI